MHTRFALSLALALLVGLPVVGCVVVDAPRGVHNGGGPPPHAPAHGYRRKHQGYDHVYDAELGVYVVVGLPSVWFLDGSYFRIVGERWELSAGVDGPWRVAAVSALPPRLYEKRHPHGGPPGQVKKRNGKNGN